MTTIAKASPKMRDLKALLARRLHPPYSAYTDLVSPTALRALAEERVRELLTRAQTSVATVSRGDCVLGAGCWSRLPWDSEQFGCEAARIDFLVSEGGYWPSREVKTSLIDQILMQCRDRGIQHLTARVDAGELDTIHCLEEAGFELIDGIQTFSLRLPPSIPDSRPTPFEIRTFRPTDLGQVVAIARKAYLFDRFHADPALSHETADAVNETWVKNSCLGKVADAVIVACEGGRILGYVTCKIDSQSADLLKVCFGSIGMVATAESVRGRGVAHAATLGALEWFRARHVDVVEVGTQLRNVPAARLYERCGFRSTAVSLTFRILV